MQSPEGPGVDSFHYPLVSSIPSISQGIFYMRPVNKCPLKQTPASKLAVTNSISVTVTGNCLLLAFLADSCEEHDFLISADQFSHYFPLYIQINVRIHPGLWIVLLFLPVCPGGRVRLTRYSAFLS